MVLSATVRRNVVDIYTYDAAGRLLKQIDGDLRTTSYAYDLSGHVVLTTQPLGTTTRAVYDAFGHKASETDANGNTATWAVDYFGLTTAHTDIGGSSVSYSYDEARQLITQTSVKGGVAAQNLRFDYDAAGQMVKVTDNALAQVTSIAYDLAGNHVAERTVQGGVVYQDNHLAYDALGRLRDVADSRVHVSIAYDKQGNRSFVSGWPHHIGKRRPDTLLTPARLRCGVRCRAHASASGSRHARWCRRLGRRSQCAC